ncbi:MAG: hypothetical protein ABJL72_19705 [Roseobacter sp.]
MRIFLTLFTVVVSTGLVLASFQARPDRAQMQRVIHDAQQLKFEELGDFFSKNGFETKPAIYYGVARYLSGEVGILRNLTADRAEDFYADCAWQCHILTAQRREDNLPFGYEHRYTFFAYINERREITVVPNHSYWMWPWP